MMMKQQHDNNRIKRSAIQMHEDQVDGTEEGSFKRKQSNEEIKKQPR